MASEISTIAQWQQHVADKLTRQKASIPLEWHIPSVPDSQANVMDIPSTCGLLSNRELEITSTSDVAELLNKLASGEWSAVEVATAFSKRAIVAHQVVRDNGPMHLETSSDMYIAYR